MTTESTRHLCRDCQFEVHVHVVGDDECQCINERHEEER